MSRLVRLYPRRWRDRYEEEFLSLLEERTTPRRLGDHRPPGMAVRDRDHVPELEPRIEDGVRGVMQMQAAVGAPRGVLPPGLSVPRG